MRFSLRAIKTVGYLLSTFHLMLLTNAGYGAPWIEVGDERIRHHIQHLADRGIIDLPLTSWPLAWADVNREIGDVFLNDLSSSELWSYRYIQHALKQATKTAKTQKRIYASNSIVPFVHFASDTREASYVGTKTTLMSDRIALNIEAKALNSPIGDDDFQFEGSYLAASTGNWIIGVGAVDHWWGPGWQSSLILSNSARPAPGIFLRRKEAFGFELPLLSLLGPWTLDVIANHLEEDRHVANTKLLAARFALKPNRFLELGHSRMTLWGGDGRLENITGLIDIILLDDPVIQTETENGFGDVREESNQLISYDARLAWRINHMSFAVYGQYLTNEEQSYAKQETATMFGVESSFSIGWTHNRIGVEISDTRNDVTTDGRRNNNAIYDHGSYHTGFRYLSRGIGESAGTNALKFSLQGDHYFAFGHQFSWRFSQVELNERTISNNFYTSSYLDQHIGEVTYKAPINTHLQASAGVFVVKEGMSLGTEEIDSGAQIQFEFRF